MDYKTVLKFENSSPGFIGSVPRTEHGFIITYIVRPPALTKAVFYFQPE